MKIHFSCKSCGTRYSALREQTGKKGTCQSCGGDIIVPTAETTEFEITDDCRAQIKHLAFIVNDGLTAYITIHDRIFKEAATFKSVLKNIFWGAVPISQLLQDAERLTPIWNGITEKIASFGSEAYSSMNENERCYFDILNRYAEAVNETVVALVKRQKLLNDRSKGGQNNPVSWSVYQEAEKTYESAIQKYMTIGQELNNASHLVFESHT